MNLSPATQLPNRLTCGRYADLFSCQELDEDTDISLMSAGSLLKLLSPIMVTDIDHTKLSLDKFS